MATLLQAESGFVHYLEAETLIGRSSGSTLMITAPHVSGHHAAIRWSAGDWQLRDLRSRNGTFVYGRRLAPDEQVTLTVGMEMAFGAPEIAYVVGSIDAPTVMLVPLEGGSPIEVDDQLIALPSAEQASATLALSESGVWTLELTDERRVLHDRELVEIDGVRYRFCTNHESVRTLSRIRSNPRVRATMVTLELACTPDEERVELTVEHDGRRAELGARSCYYALLMLARCRLGQGLPGYVQVRDAGWVLTSTLATMLRLSEQHLNVDIFRVRKALQSAGVADAVSLIERRSGLLRLATDRVVLRQL